jgi:hypothetical protein
MGGPWISKQGRNEADFEGCLNNIRGKEKNKTYLLTQWRTYIWRSFCKLGPWSQVREWKWKWKWWRWWSLKLRINLFWFWRWWSEYTGRAPHFQKVSLRSSRGFWERSLSTQQWTEHLGTHYLWTPPASSESDKLGTKLKSQKSKGYVARLLWGPCNTSESLYKEGSLNSLGDQSCRPNDYFLLEIWRPTFKAIAKDNGNRRGCWGSWVDQHFSVVA